jgi:hypothetical protein
MSCVLNVDSVSGFSILDGPLDFLLRLFVMCLAYLMLTVPLDCPFLIIPSVFFNVYLSTGEINAREKRMGNQEWAIQKHCQH